MGALSHLETPPSARRQKHNQLPILVGLNGGPARLLRRFPLFAKAWGAWLLVSNSYLDRCGWVRSFVEHRPVNRDGRPIPWFTYSAIEFLENRWPPNRRVFEFGAGFSTLWWSERSAEVVSVEDDVDWHTALGQHLGENVTLIKAHGVDAYVRALEPYRGAVAVVIVDGSFRDACVGPAIRSLEADGVLILDDSQRPGIGALAQEARDAGFKQLDFPGMKPAQLRRSCTSVFYRSTNLLGL